MKKILMTLVLSLLVFGNVFALDFDKVEQVWDKSLDIAITELDSLKDSGISRAEDVEAEVNNEMYISDLESKVVQLEAKVRLLEKEKDSLKEENNNLKEENRIARNVNEDLKTELLFYNSRGIYLSEREWDSIELEMKLLEKENNRLKELLKRKIK